MKRINYKTDFDFFLTLKTSEGTDVGFPSYDWKAYFYTYSRNNGFTASHIDGVCTNCYNDNGKIHIIADNHGLECGELKMDFIAIMPDGLFPDNKRKIFIPSSLGIVLVNGQGECPNKIDVQLMAPYIYTSAYKLARAAGFSGTEEEYIAYLNGFLREKEDFNIETLPHAEKISGTEKIPLSTGEYTQYATISQIWEGKEKPLEIIACNTSILNADIGKYYRYDTPLKDLYVKLPEIADTTTVQSIVLSFTTGDSPIVTISANADISYFNGYRIEPHTTYELNIMHNGIKWIVAYGKID